MIYSNIKDNSKRADFETLVWDIMRGYEAQGVAVSIIGKDKTLYRNFFGYKNAEEKLKIDENTRFGIASISKSFVALSIMQLQEKGIINIKNPVSMYIKGFPDDRVTIEHFLCHSGGYYPVSRTTASKISEELSLTSDANNDLAYSEDLAKRGVEVILDKLAKQERLGEPGEFLSYCNDGYGLLSEIVHLYGGESSFAEYVNKNILNPLSMDRTTMEFISVNNDDNATMQYTHRNGKLSAEKDYHDNAYALMGAGAVKSTIADLEKYVRMYIKKGLTENEIISESSIYEMVKPRAYYRHQQYYGYGISTNHVGPVTTIGHGGSLTGVSSQFIWSPELEVGVIVLCNTTAVPVSLIADSAMRWIVGLSPKMPEPLAAIKLDEGIRKSAIGKYCSDEGHEIEISERDGRAVVSILGEEFETKAVLPNLLQAKIKLSYSEIYLMMNKKCEVWAVRFGGRIIKKV